jgi:hypothetical protein
LIKQKPGVVSDPGENGAIREFQFQLLKQIGAG